MPISNQSKTVDLTFYAAATTLGRGRTGVKRTNTVSRTTKVPLATIPERLLTEDKFPSTFARQDASLGETSLKLPPTRTRSSRLRVNTERRTTSSDTNSSATLPSTTSTKRPPTRRSSRASLTSFLPTWMRGSKKSSMRFVLFRLDHSNLPCFNLVWVLLI